MFFYVNADEVDVEDEACAGGDGVRFAAAGRPNLSVTVRSSQLELILNGD
jgi:hypothetical protein